MAVDFVADVDAAGRIEAIPTILDVVCRATGMGFAAVARVTEDRWVACAVLDHLNFGLTPGGELPVETTLCRDVRQYREIVAFDHAAEDPRYSGHHTPKIYGLQSYISAPIILRDGRFFGTLCAIDPRPAQVNNSQIISMFKLFAELISVHLSADDAIRRSQTALIKEKTATFDSERRFRLLVQSVTDYAIYMLDPTGKVTNWNAGAERIKGYAADEIIGEHFSRFYTPEDAERGVPKLALQTARASGHYQSEGWRVRKDGTRFWASVVIHPIHDLGELIGFAKVTRDLTERQQTQKELEQSREALFQAQKMEAVGQLTGGLAHDFNNLLTGVIGSLEMVKARIAQGRIGDIDRLIAIADGSAQRAASLTHRLLSFARRQTLNPKATDANRLISVVLEELVKRTVGPQIRIETKLSDQLWLIHCDPHQLENTLLNLCINARDAMPNGGTITIETSNVSLSNEQKAHEKDVALGDYVAIVVRDTGTGMDAATIARAFEPFFTTKPVGVGTGLGLSMVYGFARQSGGHALIESSIGEGAAITILLPRSSQRLEEALETAQASAKRAASGETVLIVDDEATLRMLISETLDDLGYAVIEASNGEAALRLIDSNTGIDLLVTDIGMPGALSGAQLAEAAHKSQPNLEILFVTGYAEGRVHLKPRMHLLNKPFTMEQFAQKVTAIMSASGSATSRSADRIH